MTPQTKQALEMAVEALPELINTAQNEYERQAKDYDGYPNMAYRYSYLKDIADEGIKSLNACKEALEQPLNEFNPDWDGVADLVEEHKRLEIIASELQDTCDKQAIRISKLEQPAHFGGFTATDHIEKQTPVKLSVDEHKILRNALTDSVKPIVAGALKQPAQEPVGFVVGSENYPCINVGYASITDSTLEVGTPLYIHPAQLKRLSDDEINQMFDVGEAEISRLDKQLARAIEKVIATKNGMELRDE